MNSEAFVGHGSRVRLHFELRLASGEVVDTTFGGNAGALVFGDGTLPSGFETLIRGMKQGERKVFTVAPEAAFGMPNPMNVQTFSRKDFAREVDLVPGMVFSFSDAARAELPGVIQSVSDDEVVVDFNHPLSGHHLEFEVEILDVEAAEESQHGN